MAMDTGAVTTAIITTITAVVAVTITATTMTTMMTTEERAKERVDPMTMTTMEDVAGVTTMVVGTTTATSKASSKRCARIRLLLPPSSLRVKCIHNPYMNSIKKRSMHFECSVDTNYKIVQSYNM